MRWEDEKYVRIYTRDTVDWLGLSFLAQGLFCLILRKVDRAGILELGKHGRKAVAVAIGHGHQWAMLEDPLEELLADGCVRIEGDQLLVPNFIEAQEAIQSDAARKRAQRERARARVTERVTRPPATPSPRDKTSQNGTGGHETGTESHAVTPPVPNVTPPVTLSLAVPSEPSEKERLRLASLAAPPPKPRAKTGDDTLRRTLSDALVAVYVVERGGGYGFDSAKDGQALTRLLGWSRDVNEHSRRFRLALRAPAGDYSYRVDTIAAFATGRVWNHFAPTTASLPGATLTKLN